MTAPPVWSKVHKEDDTKHSLAPSMYQLCYSNVKNEVTGALDTT